MADGDEAALAELYDRWSHRVHTIAFWILKDADDAEDVVEETFWQVWRTAGGFDRRRSSGSTWLLMISRSRALDRLRARRRRVEHTAAAAASTLLDQSEAQQDIAPDVAEPSRTLAQALVALPPEQRQALELAFFQGLSHGEISAETATPLGTVKTRIRLAMQKLRDQLGLFREELL